MVMALKGRANPKPRPRWPNALLLVLTLLSLLFAGAVARGGNARRSRSGVVARFAVRAEHDLDPGRRTSWAITSPPAITGCSVTLPYFIPAPIGFGTLGAFIQLREPMRNRKMLFDVGVAGPLAGLVVALPILIIGLATSNVEPLPTQDYMLEGDLDSVRHREARDLWRMAAQRPGRRVHQPACQGRLDRPVHHRV